MGVTPSGGGVKWKRLPKRRTSERPGMDPRRMEERVIVSTVSPVQQQRQTVLWVIAILLAIIATALLTRGTNGPLGATPAMGDAPMAGARGIFAFTGQIDQNRYGLFMMDVDSSNVWCYEYLPGSRKLKLVAARSFLYDRYLENYQTDEPKPATVKLMLERERQAQGRNSGFVDAGRDEPAGKAIDIDDPVDINPPYDDRADSIEATDMGGDDVDHEPAPEVKMAAPQSPPPATPAPVAVRSNPPPPAPLPIQPVVNNPPVSNPPPTSGSGAAPLEELKEIPAKKP